VCFKFYFGRLNVTRNFTKQIKNIEILIKEEKFQVRALCALQLAGCCMMLGNKERAYDLFGKLSNFASKSSLDQIVVRQAKRYLGNGGHFSAFELLYLRRDLAKMLPIMSQVLQVLDSVAHNTKALEKREIEPKPEQKTGLTSSVNKLGSAMGLSNLGKKLSPFARKKEITDYSYDDRASYLLLRGSILKALGNLDESITSFREVGEMHDSLNEKLYTPYCLYELGESYFMKGQLPDALDAIRKCSKISGYDWEDPLRIRLRVTMDQLKKGGIPADQQQKPVTIESLLDSTKSGSSNNSGTDSFGDDDINLNDDELAVKEVNLNDNDDDE